MSTDFSASLRQRLVKHVLPEVRSDTDSVELKPGERREIAVLFLDLSGFTALSDKLDHEAVHEIAKGVMDALVDITENYGGYVDKIEGDRIMVLFGAMRAGENDTERAVSCSLLMQTAIETANDILAGTGVPITARIGINWGPVTVAPDAIGHLTAIGRTVNIASRMEEAAPTGKILVTQAVHDRCADMFLWEDRGMLGLRGVSEPVHAYSPTECIQHARPRWERLSSVCFAGFAGREQELSRLRDLARLQRSAGTGKSRLGGPRHIIVQVTGEAGIGKSRLVHEFVREVCREDGSARVLRGQTRSYAQPAYCLWSCLLRDLLDLGPGEKPDYGAFRRSILEKVPCDGMEESIPFLAELLSVRSGDRRLEELDSGAIALETRVAFRNLLKYLAEDGSLLVILDDLQWIDSTCRGVLEFAAANCDSKWPVLFLLLARPERDDGSPVEFDFRENYAVLEEMPLSAMDGQDCRGIVSSMLASAGEDGTPSVSPVVEDLLMRHSRGNPLFLEELVLDMVESGLLSFTGGRWGLSGPIGEICVPPSLTGLLQSRLDRLEDGQRSTLQKSSVLGFEFRLMLYRQLLGKLGLVEDTDASFDSLARRQFLLEKSGSKERAYEFRHVLIHDTVYSTILDSNKKLLHGIAARLLEETVSHDDKEMADILAHHWERAGDRAKAIHWGKLNLSHTVSTYQHDKALELSSKLEGWIRERPLDEDSAEMLVEVLMGRSDTLNIIGRRGEQGELLLQMRELADEFDLRQWQPRILSSLGNMFRITGRMDEAEECCTQALEMATRSGDDEHQSKVLCNIGILLRIRGELEKAEECFLSALKKNSLDGTSHVEGIILGNLGNIHFDRRDIDGAAEYYRKAMELSREVGDRRSEGIALGNLGNTCMTRGDLKEARRYYNQSLALHRAIGNRRSEGVTLSNLALLLFDHGRYDEALESSEQALEIHGETGNRRMEAITLASLGSVRMRTGLQDEAAGYYRRAVSMIEDLGLSPGGFDRMPELRKELLDRGFFGNDPPWPSHWPAPSSIDGDRL